MTPPMATAIIGFGRVAAGYAADPAMAKYYRYASHAQVLRDHSAFDWRAVVDPSEEAQASARDTWSIRDVTSSVECLQSREEIEVAVLAIPPGPSRMEAVAAFPNLRALLVEKPLGRTAAESRAFLDACASRNILVQVNLWRRADRRFRDLAAGGLTESIGPVQTGTAIYGNGLHNNGVHLVDMIRMLCGDIVCVQAIGKGRRGPHLPLPDDEDVAATLTLSSGAVVFLTPLDFRSYREVGLDLWGNTGRLAVWQEGLYIARYPVRENRAMTGEQEVASDQPQTMDSTVGDAFFAMFDDLARALHDGGSQCSPGKSALQSEMVVEAIMTSLRTGTPVSP